MFRRETTSLLASSSLSPATFGVKCIPKYSAINKDGGLVFMCCDVQDAFSRVMPNFPSAVHVANRFLDAAPVLGAKYIVTEQYPKGLGGTTKDIKLPSSVGGECMSSTSDSSFVKVFSKTLFSMVTPEVEVELPQLQKQQHPSSNKTTIQQQPHHLIVIFGIEAHVCVMQTVEDLIQRGYFVAVAADGTHSQTEENRQLALQRFLSFGPERVMVASSESILLRLVQDAKDPAMKPIQQLLKQQAPYRRLPAAM